MEWQCKPQIKWYGIRWIQCMIRVVHLSQQDLLGTEILQRISFRSLFVDLSSYCAKLVPGACWGSPMASSREAGMFWCDRVLWDALWKSSTTQSQQKGVVGEISFSWSMSSCLRLQSAGDCAENKAEEFFLDVADDGYVVASFTQVQLWALEVDEISRVSWHFAAVAM